MRAEAPARRTASHLQQLSDARADGRVMPPSPRLLPNVQAHVVIRPACQLLQPVCMSSQGFSM